MRVLRMGKSVAVPQCCTCSCRRSPSHFMLHVLPISYVKIACVASLSLYFIMGRGNEVACVYALCHLQTWIISLLRGPAPMRGLGQVSQSPVPLLFVYSSPFTVPSLFSDDSCQTTWNQYVSVHACAGVSGAHYVMYVHCCSEIHYPPPIPFVNTSSLSLAHTHTHTHTCTHTHSHTHTHSQCTHNTHNTHTHKHTHTCTHTHTPRTFTHTQTCTHTNTHTHMHTHKHTLTHSHTHMPSGH